MGHAECMGDKKNALGFWWGNLKERGHMLDLVTYGRILLKGTWKQRCEGVYWIPLVQDTCGRCCEHHSEPSGSINCEDLPD